MPFKYRNTIYFVSCFFLLSFAYTEKVSCVLRDTLFDTICIGEKYVWRENVYFKSGLYSDTVSNGEDETKIHFLSLVVKKMFMHSFTINDSGKSVLFSPGNLQYNATLGTHRCADGSIQKGTWRFAENQWDFIGGYDDVWSTTYGNVYYNGKRCDNGLVSENYDGWIDLFGWGTSGWNSGAKAYMPYSRNTDDADYFPGGSEHNCLEGTYAYADWGVYNQIGVDTPGTWRTLSAQEWDYLLFFRDSARYLSGHATVNDVPGYVCLPDCFKIPVGMTFNPIATSDNYADNKFTLNVYNIAEWQKMEEAGAIFLPNDGARNGTSVSQIAYGGFYWSTTAIDFFIAKEIEIIDYHIIVDNESRNWAQSVRLVRDYKPPITDIYDTICPTEIYEWNNNKYKETGVFADTLKTVLGCDSIVLLHLFVHPQYTINISDTICSDASYTFYEKKYNKAGIYTDTVLSPYGCKGIATLTLSVVDPIKDTITICEGDTFVWHGILCTRDSLYFDTNFFNRGCDKIPTLRLYLKKAFYTQFEDTVLAGFSSEWYGKMYTEPGLYKQIYTAQNGCDSVEALHLVVENVKYEVQVPDRCGDDEFIDFEITMLEGSLDSIYFYFSEKAHRNNFKDTVIHQLDNIIRIPNGNRAGIYQVTLLPVSRGTLLDTVTANFTILYPASVLEQHWSDFIGVLTNKYNGGYDFVSFRWYEDGILMNGETKSYIANNIKIGSSYRALLEEADGTKLMTCDLVAESIEEIMLYPVVLQRGQLMHIQTKVSSYTIEIHTVMGKKLLEKKFQNDNTILSAPQEAGIYIVTIRLGDNKTTRRKIIVN